MEKELKEKISQIQEWANGESHLVSRKGVYYPNDNDNTFDSLQDGIYIGKIEASKVALEIIKKQQEIIEKVKEIIHYNNFIDGKDKYIDPFYYKNYMSDFIEVIEKKINKMEQEND